LKHFIGRLHELIGENITKQLSKELYSNGYIYS